MNGELRTGDYSTLQESNFLLAFPLLVSEQIVGASETVTFIPPEGLEDMTGNFLTYFQLTTSWIGNHTRCILSPMNINNSH